MAGVRGILVNWFHQAITAHHDLFIGASASARFGLEPCLLWRSPAAAREARIRGLQLLRENLSPAQRDQYERHRYFDVVGGETGTRYRITHGSQANVLQLDIKGKPVCCWCFVPKGELPLGDIMLAQKLALELFESEMLKVANKFPPHPFASLPM